MAEIPGYPCPICGYVAGTPGGLRAHLAAGHPVEQSVTSAAEALWAAREAIAKMHDPTGVIERMEVSPEVVADLQRTMAEPMGPEEALKKPYSLASVYYGKLKAAADTDKWFGEKVFGATLLEAIPFVDVGSSTLRYLGVPRHSARITQATEFFRSEWDVGMKPYIQRWWNWKYQGLLPETYRLAIAAAKGIIPDVYYKEAMYESGLNEYWANLWLLQNYEYPALEVALALLRRGEIGDADFDLWMERSALPDDVRVHIVKLRDVIPPLPDLIRMAVREAFGEHTYEEQMPALLEWGAKMGLSGDWVDRYWYAHWERIPLAQMYDNLYREHWTEEDFDRMLRIKDVHPDDRKPIIDVAYRPPFLRTLGYGWDTGKMDRPFIDEMFKWRGIDPEIRPKVVDSFIAYRLSAEIEAVRRELLWRYTHDRITREEFEAELMAKPLETRKEIADMWLLRGDYQRERLLTPETAIEYRIVTSSEALWAFKNLLRPEQWLREKLKDLDWTDERIDVAVDRAKREMEPAPPPEVVPRRLTAAQLRSLYQAHKISGDVLAQRLQVELEYSVEDAAALADLWTPPPVEVPVKPYTDSWARRLYAYRILDFDELYNNYLSMDYDGVHAWDMTLATILAEEYPALTAAYSKGYINEETFLSRLFELGMEFDDANELLERTIRDFQYERLEKERDLTKAEIVKGVKTGVIDVWGGVALLSDIGYEEWEAEYILEINRVVAAGDPESYWEMRRVTEAYKKAVGKPYVEIPAEVLMLEEEVRKKRQEIEKMREEEATEAEISVKVGEQAAIEARLRTVLAAKKIE